MADTHVAESLLGTLVDGRYRVGDRLARGGMATVYLATDERLDRTVALKIVHDDQAAAAPLQRDRFADEARAIARLTHPNVVAAYDQGTFRGAPYLVMEYVPGRTLREVLAARGRLGVAEAMAIIEQVLAALAAAHHAELVHRDVKPENVMVTAAPSGGPGDLVDSVVKVTDFGLAQAVQAARATADQQDPLLATVAYVAPELVAEGRADPRSDLYSAGIVLYEMLTSRVPYDGGTPTALAWRHVEEDVPPPSRLVPDLPPEVDAVVLRATRRDRSERVRDAGTMLAEVRTAREAVAARAAAGGGRDETVVMPRVPGSERPAWARLPSGGPPGPGDRRSAAAGPVRGGHRRVRGDASSPGLAGVVAAVAPYRRRLGVVGLVALLLVLALVGWWFGVGRWTPAPDLVGLSEAEAVAAAERQGLTVDMAPPRHDDEVPAGHVLAQDPEGRVVRGGTVTLTLSLGPEAYPVPDVIGASAEVAVRQLETLGLVVVQGEPEYSQTVPEGRVISVQPGVGEQVSGGAEVTIVVSKGQPPINVPSVVGQQEDAARTALEALGLAVTVERVENNEPAGQVIRQDPAGNTGAEPGDTVTLTVSEGPPTVPVPDVSGQSCEDATDTLTEAGFEVEYGFRERGRVQIQNPSAGTGIRRGETVTIWCL